MRRLFRHHPRQWQDFQYVYPVISRRSKGLSIGVNLSLDRVCNFDCIYCFVDRSTPTPPGEVDLTVVRRELDQMLGYVGSGKIWDEQQFAAVDSAYRRITDVAFSGNGEPTAYSRFDDVVRMAGDLKTAHRLNDVKLVVITNASLLHWPTVQRALDILDRNNGEVWVKLDAGTPGYFHRINRTGVSLDKIRQNILLCGRDRPIVIQSLFVQLHGHPISDHEFDAYLHQLLQLQDQGCRIRALQLHTVARGAREQYVSPLSDRQLDNLADRLTRAMPNVSVEVAYGVD